MTHSPFETSRRRFIAGFVAAAGATGAASAAPWTLQIANAAGLADAAGERVRLGVIGCGDRGRGLIENLLQSRNCEVAALCDDYEPNLGKAQALVGKRVPALADYRKLLGVRGLQGVVIATPLHEHAHITIAALDAGVHVFCEKAMARTVEDCAAMVEKSRSTRRILQIGHQRLFKPTYLNALARIQAGEIGRVVQVRAYWHRNASWRRPVPEPSLERRINWRLYKEYSGGLMTELACHQIQVANWFMDAVPTRVMGSGSLTHWKDGREVDDHVALIYEYDGGRKLIYDSLICNKRYGCEEEIQGDKGTIEAEVAQLFPETPPPVPGLKQLVEDVAAGQNRPVPIGGATWSPELAITEKGISLGEGEYNETQLQLEGFAEAIKANRPIPGLLREAFHASIGSLLGEQAMASGQPVAWPKSLVMAKGS